MTNGTTSRPGAAGRLTVAAAGRVERSGIFAFKYGRGRALLIIIAFCIAGLHCACNRVEPVGNTTKGPGGATKPAVGVVKCFDAVIQSRNVVFAIDLSGRMVGVDTGLNDLEEAKKQVLAAIEQMEAAQSFDVIGVDRFAPRERFGGLVPATTANKHAASQVINDLLVRTVTYAGPTIERATEILSKAAPAGNRDNALIIITNHSWPAIANEALFKASRQGIRVYPVLMDCEDTEAIAQMEEIAKATGGKVIKYKTATSKPND